MNVLVCSNDETILAVHAMASGFFMRAWATSNDTLSSVVAATKKRKSDHDVSDIGAPQTKVPRIEELDEDEEGGNTDKKSEFELQWNDDQKRAIEAVVRFGQNTFITGPGGSGKTALLKYIVSELQKKHGHHNVHVCATTGIAALPLKGSTVHSFAGVGLGEEPVEELIKQIFEKKPRIRKRWADAIVLVIDEISMLHAKFFEKLDAIARAMKTKKEQKSLPFGGIQLVLTGDFLQLPPVDRKKDGGERDSKDALYAFQSPLWSKTVECMVGLKQIYRQKDDAFMNLLNRLRYGALTVSDVNLLKTRIITNPKAVDRNKATFLYPHREPAAAHNQTQLKRIQSPSMTFEASDWYNSAIPEASAALQMLQKNCTAAETIVLKRGALVVLLKNLFPACGLVNGSRGVVVDMHETLRIKTSTLLKSEKGPLQEDSDDQDDTVQPKMIKKDAPSVCSLEKVETNEEAADSADLGLMLAVPGAQAVTVQFDNGVLATISASQWSVEGTRYGRDGDEPTVLCTRSQIPFCLAWAISIHKSQGMTLESACVSLQKVFAAGQGYVACGRLTSLEGLTILEDFDPSKFMVDPNVVQFYKEHGLC